MTTKNTISAEWLRDHLGDNDLVIADCRFELGNPDKGFEAYTKEHIAGAVYMDLEQDLSAPIATHGGRHPLPSSERLITVFSKAGIDSSKMLVCYDDQGGAMASRLWWMLKYAGHDHAVILEEGFSAWKTRGFPTSNEKPNPEMAQFVPKIQPNMLATMEEVKQKITDDDVLLIDSRSAERYSGDKEPVDPVAGHIPRAVNEDWQNRLANGGKWKSKQDQAEDLNKYVKADKELIVYCGSGVTACANVLAFDEVGLKPKLYAGSWSDWITYENNPIHTGNGKKV
ncbi:sulfurtransferase [Alteribacter populi]|uniref:sulfurtransferase n=1 Tax=Alteribacter populi TaxID=2011011 RepID=UPI000BBA8E81|nr:sulfurtransferase [Alteribacter populi]